MLQILLRTVASLVLVAGVLVLISRLRPATAAKLWQIAFAITIAVGTTSMVTHSFVAKWAFRGDNKQDGLIALVDGTAYRPFVYRRLAPVVVGATSNAILKHAPESVQESMLRTSPLVRYTASWGEVWDMRKAALFHATYLLFWMCLFGSFFASAVLLRAVIGLTWFEAILGATVGMCLLPLMFCTGGYLYDAPELLLWSALLWVAVRGPLPLAPVLFGLMLVNKESALVVIPALLPLFGARVGLRRALMLGGFLGIIGVTWEVWVHREFAHLPGDAVAPMFATNAKFWTHPLTYLGVGSPFAPGLPAMRGGNLLLFVLALIPIRFGLFEVPAPFRLATIIMALIMLPLFIVAGATDEMRGLLLLLVPLFVIQVAGVKWLLRTQRRFAEVSTERAGT